MHIATPSTIGDNNKFAILDLVKKKDGIGREEIARSLSLSAPAVSKNVNALLEAGILYEHGTADTTLGRKPVLLYCNTHLLYVIVVEVMPQGIRAALADFAGEILCEAERPSKVRDSVGAILDEVYSIIQSLLDKRPQPREVACICIAQPGCTDQKNGFNLLSVYQQAWDDVNLGDKVWEQFGIHTIVMNDVEMDLLGERRCGAGANCRNILLVKYGDGVACRALIDGKLFRGARCTAGEIGYAINSVDDVRPRFRSPGVLEQRMSHDVFADYISEAGYRGPAEDVNFGFLINRAADGDTVAEKYVGEVTDLMAVVVNNTVLVINPELLILAGDAALLRDSDVARIDSILQRTCPYAPQIRRARLGKNSGLYGGISVALRNAEKRLVELWK